MRTKHFTSSKGELHSFRMANGMKSVPTAHSRRHREILRVCVEEFAKPSVPDMSRIIEIGAEHGIHFVQ